jgi:hypothetical protein
MGAANLALVRASEVILPRAAIRHLEGRRRPDDNGMPGPKTGGAAMQIVRSATSVSRIPSDSIPGPLRLLMEKGLMHYDPPPPLTITDLESMRRKGEFRFANVLRAWIEVEDGKIRDYRYAGGVVMGLTPVTVGGLRVLLPTKGNPEIRHSPQVAGNSVTFVQTAGGAPRVLLPQANLALAVPGHPAVHHLDHH